MRKPKADEYNLVELLQNKKYYIDDYQREYKWKTRQIKELIYDLSEKFFEDHREGNELSEVKNYGTYFLGSILISDKNGSDYIVDGQQRITSLILILMYLHNLLKEKNMLDKISLLPLLIYSQTVEGNSYNIDVPERNICMEAIFNDKEEEINLIDQLESNVNLVNRYKNIKELFSEDIKKNLLHFAWWLIGNVFIVKITTFSDNDAYTIFETMNDRGLNLDSTEMLKGYLLANIDENKRKEANNLWKNRLNKLNEFGKEEATDFFKSWIRAKYAETYRKKKNNESGYIQKDFEKIGNAFHKWIRDNKEKIGLRKSSDFFNFIMKEFEFYSRLYLRIRNYEKISKKGYEEIYYNSHNNFTLQIMLIFSVVKSCDSDEIINKKLNLISSFIDIFIARNLVNFRALGYSYIMYRVFNFVKDLRNYEIEKAHSYIVNNLENLEEKFNGMDKFVLHKQNRKKVHYLLARLTSFIELESGFSSNFEKYVNKGDHKPFEIEHVIPNKYERYESFFDSEVDFDNTRNKLGNLILLPRGTNQSLGDDRFVKKVIRYASENILAQTLSENCYKNNPNFLNFKNKFDLDFKPYDKFEKSEILERNELYEKAFNKIWDIKKLDKIIE